MSIQEFDLDQVEIKGNNEVDCWGNEILTDATIEIKQKPLLETLGGPQKKYLNIFLNNAKKDDKIGRDYWIVLMGFLFRDMTSNQIASLTFMEASIKLEQIDLDRAQVFNNWCNRKGLKPNDHIFTSHTTNSPLSGQSLYRIIQDIVKKTHKNKKKGGISFLKALYDRIVKGIAWRFEVLQESGYLPSTKFSSKDEWEQYIKEKNEDSIDLDEIFASLPAH